ncbi:hypothetical protein BJ508DRAFT_187325, partial [Ascobolus immersus RN42]
ERRIKTALKILSTEFPRYSLRQASADYSIPYSTLHGRFQGALPKALAHQHQQWLHPQQERALIQELKEQDDFGYPATRAALIEMANALL